MRYSQSTPLNRLVDAARGDSEIVRTLERNVRSQIEVPAIESAASIRTTLTRWRDNNALFMPYAVSSSLLNGTAELSADLAQIASIGLEALTRIEQGQRGDEAWLSGKLAQLDALAKPKLEVVHASVRPVRLLIDAVK
jgi:hexosaminidase